MSEYIDRDEFLTKERAWYCKNCIRRMDSTGKMVYEIGETPCLACHINDLLDEVENCPAAEVVGRKTGKWVKISPAGIRECSLCHHSILTSDIDVYKFCFSCGAQMIGGDEDEDV